MNLRTDVCMHACRHKRRCVIVGNCVKVIRDYEYENMNLLLTCLKNCSEKFVVFIALLKEINLLSDTFVFPDYP